MTGPVQPWSRTRLLTALAAAVVAALLLLAGLGYAVYSMVVPSRPGGPVATLPRLLSRDEMAAAPMLTVPRAAARPTAPAEVPALTITVPPATRPGSAGVPTGYPHTPEGAVGQLAAIETIVLPAMSVPVAGAVHDAWALPGAVPVADWELTGAVRAFLAAAGTEALDPSSYVMVEPTAGLVKGSDGPDWVVVCVLVEVRARIVTEAAMGWGHCSRMQWAGDRWMIAAGPPPAPAPSTWPGSQASVAAGWHAWTAVGVGER